MAVLWSDESPPLSKSPHVLTGDRAVLTFFFCFEHVEVRGIGSIEKSFELPAHLNRTAFELCSEKLTVHVVISEAGKNLDSVQGQFWEAHKTRRAPKSIREATGAVLNRENTLSAVYSLDRKYYRAVSSDETKPGFFRVAMKKVPPVAEFAMYCRVPTYDESKTAVEDYGSRTREFWSRRRNDRKNAGEGL